MEKANIRTLKDLVHFLQANLVFIFLLISLVSACYINVSNGQLLSADDEPVILRDTQLRDFNKTAGTLLLHDILFSVFINTSGANPVPFHLLSITLHMLNSILVFVLLYLLFGRRVSVIASLLFAVFPVNTEAVAWISAVTYLINGFFGLFTLIAFVLFKQTGNKTFLYISGSVFFAGTILARNAWILTILPILFIVSEFLLENGEGFAVRNFKRLGVFIPFAIAAVFFIATYVTKEFAFRIQSLEDTYSIDPTSTTPLLNRIPYTIYMMLSLLVWPAKLSIYHEGVIISQTLYAVMVLITIVYFGTIFYLLKKNKVAAGIMMILPLSIFPSFSPVLIAWFIAERYLYLASVFFCAGVALLILAIEKRSKSTKLAVYATVLLLSVYCLRTVIRTNDFKTNLNIWLATAKTAPYSYRTYNNLGDAYGRTDNYKAAITSYENAIKLYPGYADATHNLANTYMQMGELGKAEEYFTKAYTFNPKLYQSLYMLGLVNYKQGDLDKAEESFRQALDLSPNNREIQKALEMVEAKLNAEKK